MKIAFYKGRGDYVDWTIRWWTGGIYSHCELIFSDNTWFSSSYRDGGVRFKKIDPNENSWDYLDLPITSTEESVIRQWCERQHGPYDICGILSFMVWFAKQSKEDWFCSEICLAALQQVQLFSEIDPSKVSPNGLYKIISKV